ncbi:membrane protease YdiL (CAAX protease family) [Cryobacterium sp. MP_M5]|uniref:CPBP family intramembrane glutamic endopeptidase n=1 Tax=unclassified Cryobacterium TaxID=2649013 RepID=UPI0018C9B2CF|nr:MULTISPECIES: type II CAAX endopeptidase family protein [unclassified Cryobacterium]MBG6060096.1 membrane protease YdiL (CAAX protease family) [Cryobacterium sp. MP_M3]MEC5178514.1 membrane protease YdiL (CAAX protease family) [Cryobacterium sp. MP_M5]
MTTSQPVAPPDYPESNRTTTRSPLGWRATLGILATLLLVTVLVFGSVALAILFIPGGRDIALPLLAVTLVVHATLMLLTLHWGLRRAGSGWHQMGLTQPTPRILHLLWQIPTIVLLLAAVQGTAFALTGETASNNDGIDTLFAGVGPLLVATTFVGVALLTPIWEEMVFRGLIYGGLRRRLGFLPATVLSAAAFALVHGIPILLPYLITAGIALAYLREFHTTLWAPITLHVTLNTFAAAVTLTAIQT